MHNIVSIFPCLWIINCFGLNLDSFWLPPSHRLVKQNKKRTGKNIQWRLCLYFILFFFYSPTVYFQRFLHTWLVLGWMAWSSCLWRNSCSWRLTTTASHSPPPKGSWLVTPSSEHKWPIRSWEQQPLIVLRQRGRGSWLPDLNITDKLEAENNSLS